MIGSFSTHHTSLITQHATAAWILKSHYIIIIIILIFKPNDTSVRFWYVVVEVGSIFMTALPAALAPAQLGITDA